MDTGFPALLREWRSLRRLSQLDLGLAAEVSARHISFLETGRAKPSRAMVLHLCQCLDVPHGIRNRFLHEAGFASLYAARDLESDEMAYVREALSWSLDRHEPYPGLALDRHWRIVQANRPARHLLQWLEIREGDSLLSALLEGRLALSVIANAAEIMPLMIARLRAESAYLGGDPVLDAAAGALAGSTTADPPDKSAPPAFIPVVFDLGGGKLSFLSTIAQFGSVQDIAISEIKMEMFFPADQATREILHQGLAHWRSTKGT